MRVWFVLTSLRFVCVSEERICTFPSKNILKIIRRQSDHILKMDGVLNISQKPYVFGVSLLPVLSAAVAPLTPTACWT